MEDNEFKCDRCGGVFEKARSDEDAMADARTRFTEEELRDKSIVCDDCHEELLMIMAEMN